jgi:glycosyltransferase involved in cell wall biosynthesis
MLSVDRIAVIVAVYNAESTIEACIRSLLEMRRGSYALELIIVDNGSTDRTRTIVAGFGDRLRLLTEPKRGPAAARNRGIREATAEWIAFTDADCVVEPDWLFELVPPLAEPGVGISGGKIMSIEPCNRIERFGERIHDHRVAIESQNPPYAITMNWASRREVLLRAGLFDENLMRGSDTDLAFRIHALGYELVYRGNAAIHHHNERTFRGLFHEGFMHGFGAERIRAKALHAPAVQPHRFATERRVLRNMGGFVTGRRLGHFDSLCAVVFDAGKLAGEMKERHAHRKS